MHYRVQHGNHLGYHYNPYTDWGAYGSYGYPYGYGASASASEEYKHSVSYGQGPVFPEIAGDAAEPVEEEEGLSTGAIVGIVVGSVVGFLLILALLYILCT